MRPFLVIDCSCICHAVRHRLGHLRHGSQGTGIVFGFLAKIQALYDRYEPHGFLFCWDSRKSVRRHEFPGYKNRPKTPDDLEAYEQFDLLRGTILPAMGFKNSYHQPGFEADDLIAALVMNPPPASRFVVVSSDQDLYQLLDHCSIVHPFTRKTMSRRLFTGRYGIPPTQWVGVKCMAGCSSDTLPGIAGIGETRALQFLRGELKETTVAYQRIVSDEGTWITCRNQPLVALPHAGTRLPQISDECLYDGNVKAVFETYGLRSLLEPENWTVWDRMSVPF